MPPLTSIFRSDMAGLSKYNKQYNNLHNRLRPLSYGANVRTYFSGSRHLIMIWTISLKMRQKSSPFEEYFQFSKTVVYFWEIGNAMIFLVTFFVIRLYVWITCFRYLYYLLSWETLLKLLSSSTSYVGDIHTSQMLRGYQTVAPNHTKFKLLRDCEESHLTKNNVDQKQSKFDCVQISFLINIVFE